MTRVKKTRSLKRVHSVKTGSISKLKRAAGNDRQVGKRVEGRRVLSAYEKYLLENPQAKEKDIPAKKATAQPKVAEVVAKDKRTKKDEKPGKEDLLAQLDNKDFGNLY